MMDDTSQGTDQLANDAVDKAQGVASGAKATGQDVARKVSDIAGSAKKAAGDVAAAGRDYATGAVNAAGKKIDGFKSQVDQTTDYFMKLINDEPVKSVLVTAVVSSLLTAVVMSSLRGNRRFWQ